MLKLLYIANCSAPFRLSEIGEKDIFKIERKDTLVDIVTYCLMPNHFHIAVSARSDLVVDPGISKFVRKLCTGYSGYYNCKYLHSGTIWQGNYKDKIADDELDYMRTLISYIHLNPYKLKEPNLTREARFGRREEALAYSREYEFSGLRDFLYHEVRPREQAAILCQTELERWLYHEVGPRGATDQSPSMPLLLQAPAVLL